MLEWNGYGQLGYGDTTNRSSPGGNVNAGGVATQISNGFGSSCAVLFTHSVHCWGWNIFGQLGYGDTTELTSPGGDVNVGGIVTQISLGDQSICALLNTGNIRCWGASQLGYGDTTNRVSPGPDIFSFPVLPVYVSFDGLQATSVTLVNSNQLTAVTPVHLSGLVDVVVTNGDRATATLADSYTYNAFSVTAITNSNISAPSSPPANTTVTCTLTTNVNLNTLSGAVNLRIGSSGTVVSCPVTGSGTSLVCNNISVGSTPTTSTPQDQAQPTLMPQVVI